MSQLRVALAFDAEHPDRPHGTGIAEGIVDRLRAEAVTATFFLQGRWVEANPDLAARIAADGHLIGSHSFYHARLTVLTGGGLEEDVRCAEHAILAATGVDPRPWYRCPFGAGADDRRILRALAALGYRDVRSDVVLDDWEPGTTPVAIAAGAIREVARIGDGAIVLFHAWPSQTLEALPATLAGLRGIGATFVTVAELADGQTTRPVA